MEQHHLDLVRSELEAIRDSLLKIWAIYMTWYTWFFGANLLVIGWLFTADHPPTAERTMLLSLAWIVFNTTGLISSLKMRSYTTAASRHAAQLVDVVNRSSALPFQLRPEMSSPRVWPDSLPYSMR